jgi:nucleotide-binding universal stress UspA family protein
MSKVILLAVDTASHTSAAADLVRDLATGAGDRIVVLHVHEFAVGRFGRIQIDCADGEGEHAVAEIVERLRGFGRTAEPDVRKTPVGHIGRTILGVADEIDARMIVLGSTSVHDVPRLPFGSVSLRLLHSATRPVLIVPKAPVAQEERVRAVAGATA